MTTRLTWKSLKCIFLFLWVTFILNPGCLYSQEIDSSKISRKEKKIREKEEYTFQTEGGFFSDHSPKKATYLALVPGLGQIYNRKYWKLPIVYAGFAVTGYFAYTNRIQYKDYKEAYICAANAEADPDYNCDNPLAQKYSVASLQSGMDYYRRNMELSYIVMGVWYILQMLDATVDAHLFYWDVSDDITIQAQPLIKPNMVQATMPSESYGVTISVSF